MKRAAPWIVLILALLVAGAFLLRRAPREEAPRRLPRPPAAVAEAAVPVASAPRVVIPPVPPESTVASAAQPPGPTGTVRGLVKIKGPIPMRKPVKFKADPYCDELHAGVTILMDDIVADANGNVQWAFVYVRSGPIGRPPPPPPAPVLMDQVHCMFTPHVVGIRVGQPLRVLSNDQTLHNVHGLGFKNKEFNIPLIHAGLEEVRTFDAPEIMFSIKCDIHPWMRAWIGVMDHPYFSITNEIGSYTIPDLPPGKYSIEAWHEKYVSVATEVDVPPGGDVRLDFLLDARKQ